MKHLQKLFSLILVLVLVAALPLAVYAEGEDGGSVGGDGELVIDAKLYVKSAEKLTLAAGEITSFPLLVASRTGDYCEDVRISITGSDDYKDKFSLQDPTGWYKVKSLRRELRITPTINVAADLPDGRYTLLVSFQYADAWGNYFTSNDTLTVTVYGDSSDRLYIASAKFQSEEVGKENKSPLELSLYNPTKSTLYDTKVAFTPKEGEKFSLYEEFQPVNIHSINPGETGTAVFYIYMEQSLQSGNYPLTFTVSYRDPGGSIYTSTETVYAEVRRSAEVEEQDGSKPRIIIQSYQTDVEVIEAGKSFDLTFTLQNTSADTEVSNVKVVLDSESAGTGTTATTPNNGVFFPSEGSNSFYIERIAPKGTVTESITLTTSQDVEPGVYSLILDIEYDAGGSAVSPSQEKLAFPVAQQQRLDIQGFSVESSAMMGSSVPVSFQYINKGKATIYNFSVDVEGDFTLEDTTMSYIGNLSSGYNDTYENYLVPQKEGECRGAILFKYEDSQGQEKVEKEEFTVMVESMDMPTDIGMGGIQFDPETGYPLDPETGLPIDPETGEPVKQGGIPLIVFICGGVAILAAGIVTLILILRRKKKAREQAEDEED